MVVKILCLVCSAAIALCSSILIKNTLLSRNNGYVANAGPSLASITIGDPGRKRGAEKASIQFVADGAITMPWLDPGSYLAHVKVSPDGAIYFRTNSPPAGDVQIIRFDPTSNTHRNILNDPDVRRIWTDRTHLQDYDVASNGDVYVAMSHSMDPTAVLVLSPAGELLHEIRTDGFLPNRICADSNGKVWIFGAVILPDKMLGEHQVRVYSKDGRLVNIPITGIGKEFEASCNIVSLGDAGVRFTCPANRAVYSFANEKVYRSYACPFDQLDGAGPMLETAKAKPGVIRLLQVQDKVVWYELRQTNENDGFLNEYIGLLSPDGQAITPETKLNGDFKSLAGIGSDGEFYFFENGDSGIQLKKAQMTIVN